MRVGRRIAVMGIAVAAAAAAGLVWFAVPVIAQSGDTFTARLAWVPTTVRDRANVTGSGSVTARLSGTTLSIDGTFEGLAAPATAARLHEGVALGARGPAFHDLTIARAASGAITGSVTLTSAQIDSLRAGKVYVQVHSEKGTDDDGSNLWGWLLR